jgi:dolichol-phosphate mannosyltransferase
MTSSPSSDHSRLFKAVQWLKTLRYVKFGLVGASGTVVNLAVLYVAHHFIFNGIEAPGSRPYFSLALAIAIATVNNFTWNRLWTWADRVQANAHNPRAAHPGLPGQFARYTAASWFGIALQYALTLWFTDALRELAPVLPATLRLLTANVAAIVIASVANFLANDWWTFRRVKAT